MNEFSSEEWGKVFTLLREFSEGIFIWESTVIRVFYSLLRKCLSQNSRPSIFFHSKCNTFCHIFNWPLCLYHNRKSITSQTILNKIYLWCIIILFTGEFTEKTIVEGHKLGVNLCLEEVSAYEEEEKEEEAVTALMRACFVDKYWTVLLVGPTSWIVDFVSRALSWKRYTRVSSLSWKRYTRVSFSNLVWPCTCKYCVFCRK